MTQKLISMTEKELSRINVIQNLIDGKINGTDASKQIGISIRHIRRLKLRVGKYGTEGLIHKSRGRTSNRKLDSEIVKKVEQHLKEKYYDFGPTLASEKLEEDDNIKLDKETLRGIMTRMGLWKPKPRKQAKKKHFWRPRKDNFGEMEQFDGSYHIWFGDEESCLLLSVDDATGKITHAKFDYNESVIAVFKFWIEYFEKNGLPISIYLDKFSTYKVNHKNAVDNKDMITQFERAINQIGVKPITAHSPEAKGRVERMNKTLQDRLIKELRLANISTMEQANEFLKEYVPKLIFETELELPPLGPATKEPILASS
ncbi:ISNCY family transposase [Patescibacteria group bacterium]|nr:ISNCY family transposase [Patescibacteria group bacterium]